jgi:hypothetical protein
MHVALSLSALRHPSVHSLGSFSKEHSASCQCLEGIYSVLWMGSDILIVSFTRAWNLVSNGRQRLSCEQVISMHVLSLMHPLTCVYAGIICVGMKLSGGDIAASASVAIPAVCVSITTGLVAGTVFSKWAGEEVSPLHVYKCT